MEKRATLTACLRKVQQMASDQQSDVFATAALDKISGIPEAPLPIERPDKVLHIPRCYDRGRAMVHSTGRTPVITERSKGR